jgi:NADH dehydrogenase FAD-containing subunit
MELTMPSIKGVNAGSQRWRVIIVGGGFGGLRAAQALKSVPVEVTLIDRRSYHLFQPLLYQVATGSLSPGEIAAPLRSVLSRFQSRIPVFIQRALQDLTFNRGARLITGPAATDFDFNKEMASKEGGRAAGASG